MDYARTSRAKSVHRGNSKMLPARALREKKTESRENLGGNTGENTGHTGGCPHQDKSFRSLHQEGANVVDTCLSQLGLQERLAPSFLDPKCPCRKLYSSITTCTKKTVAKPTTSEVPANDWFECGWATGTGSTCGSLLKEALTISMKLDADMMGRTRQTQKKRAR